MTDLLPELAQFAAVLDAEPGPKQAAFQYALCLLMCQTGKMRLVETILGENGPCFVFETTAGDRFSVIRPPMSTEAEATLVEKLQEILDEQPPLETGGSTSLKSINVTDTLTNKDDDNDYQVGPFLCDRCGAVLRDSRIVLSGGSLIIAAGYCPRHGGIWSKPVALPPLPVGAQTGDG